MASDILLIRVWPVIHSAKHYEFLLSVALTSQWLLAPTDKGSKREVGGSASARQLNLIWGEQGLYKPWGVVSKEHVHYWLDRIRQWDASFA